MKRAVVLRLARLRTHARLPIATARGPRQIALRPRAQVTDVSRTRHFIMSSRCLQTAYGTTTQPLVTREAVFA
jgi:hypothetical protein